MSYKIIFSSVLMAASFFIFAFPAYALTISPARVEIAGDPATRIGGQFTLINEQSTTQKFYVSYENFSAQGETGSPTFSSEKIGLDTWISTPQSQITIPSGQVLKIPYVITIPQNAEPGGYFAVVFLSTTPPSTTTGEVSIGAKIGMLVLLTVKGDVREAAGITQFDRDGHGFFYKTLPVTLRYKFHNDGADRVQPQGMLTIRDTLFLPAAHIDANNEIGNILPNSTRQFKVTWIKEAVSTPPHGFFAAAKYEWQNFALGLYSARINVAYGSKGLHAAHTLWFFVFPWELSICLLIAILFIWYGGKTIIIRYNRYVIRQAQKTGRFSDAEKI
jgi:hypothetical protein